ncbi:hypothetical protein IKF63_01200 [Candidatus Saccharibacteria bacterium]|nr:hypothetical protein [Candidatus Saccharibacteria bacterium]MBR3180679.1 hypothetical protein [Candidatus Saccharibacteria bacterium]
MEEPTIDVKGNFAVRVGKMWAGEESYSESVSLSEQPKQLCSFAKAATLAEKTGGSVVMFKPIDLTEEQIADLKLAATAANEK